MESSRTEQVRLKSYCELLQLIVIMSDYKEGVNKYNNPIQTPLLLSRSHKLLTVFCYCNIAAEICNVENLLFIY
jgi:hypothetical protein